MVKMLISSFLLVSLLVASNEQFIYIGGDRDVLIRACMNLPTEEQRQQCIKSLLDSQ